MSKLLQLTQKTIKLKKTWKKTFFFNFFSNALKYVVFWHKNFPSNYEPSWIINLAVKQWTVSTSFKICFFASNWNFEVCKLTFTVNNSCLCSAAQEKTINKFAFVKKKTKGGYWTQKQAIPKQFGNVPNFFSTNCASVGPLVSIKSWKSYF